MPSLSRHRWCWLVNKNHEGVAEKTHTAQHGYVQCIWFLGRLLWIGGSSGGFESKLAAGHRKGASSLRCSAHRVVSSRAPSSTRHVRPWAWRRGVALHMHRAILWLVPERSNHHTCRLGHQAHGQLGSASRTPCKHWVLARFWFWRKHTLHILACVRSAPALPGHFSYRRLF